jgi:hypothetical protein
VALLRLLGLPESAEPCDEQQDNGRWQQATESNHAA